MIETLVDQLPNLVDLLRYLEELGLMAAPQDSMVSKMALGIEQIPEIYETIIESINWDVLVKLHRETLWNESMEVRQATAQRLAQMYNFDDLEALLDDPKCAKCGNVASQRCSRCKNEWYCSRPCQVGSWKAHKGVCDVLCDDQQDRPLVST